MMNDILAIALMVCGAAFAIVSCIYLIRGDVVLTAAFTFLWIVTTITARGMDKQA